MSKSKEESSHNRNNKLLLEAITTKMEQVMDSKFKALRQEIRQLGPRQTQPAPKKSKPFTTNQTSHFQKRLDRSKTYDDLERQIREAFKAVAKSKKKSTAPRPSSEIDSISQAKCKLPSTESELMLDNENTCAKLTHIEPVQPSSVKSPLQVQEEVQPEESTRSSPLIVDVEQPSSHEPEPIIKHLSHNNPKHCKETSLFKPSLFVLVSAQEEKRFGLEHVKEFCVFGKVFDKMASSFETFDPKKFFKQKQFMSCELDPSLTYSLGFKTFELFRTKADFAFAKAFSKITPLIENGLCVSNPFSKLCELNSKDHVFYTHFSKIAQSNLFASNRTTLFSLCSKDIFCVNMCPNAKVVYDLFDNTNIIHLPLSKESYAGYKETLKRKKSVQRWEENKRFKPPDLDPDNRQNISFFILVKEAPPDLDQDTHPVINFFLLIKQAPPDAPYKPKPSQSPFGGMFLFPYNPLSTNLFHVHAEGSDLRTNPFQVGGDDVILRTTGRPPGRTDASADELTDEHMDDPLNGRPAAKKNDPTGLEVATNGPVARTWNKELEEDTLGALTNVPASVPSDPALTQTIPSFTIPSFTILNPKPTSLVRPSTILNPTPIPSDPVSSTLDPIPVPLDPDPTTPASALTSAILTSALPSTSLIPTRPSPRPPDGRTQPTDDPERPNPGHWFLTSGQSDQLYSFSPFLVLSQWVFQDGFLMRQLGHFLPKAFVKSKPTFSLLCI